MNNDIKKYVGDKTLEKMCETEWMAYARVIADILYNGEVINYTIDKDGMYKAVKAADVKEPLRVTRKYVVPENVYVGQRITARYGKAFLTEDGNSINMEKFLHELLHVLECAALKEVT